MRTIKTLVLLLLAMFLVPLQPASAESPSSNPGYLVGAFTFPGFTTTSLSLTAVGGGKTSQLTSYNNSNYLMTLDGGDWDYSVSSSCGLSGGNNTALSVSFNQRRVPVAPGETVTNNYVFTPGIIRFQVNISGDPTTSSSSTGSWATKAVADGEKTATFSAGTPATAARSYSWDLPVVPNQQIELTAKIDVASASGVKRYTFNKTAASPYALLPRDVAPGEVVIVPLAINFVEGVQPPAAALNKGTVAGSIGLLGLPANNFVRHNANNLNLTTNPAQHSRDFSFSTNQYSVLIGVPNTYFDESIDSSLRWPYIHGVASNNQVTVYPDSTQYLDFERVGGLLSGKINLLGTVKNEDLKAITFNFAGLGENTYGSAILKRDSVISTIKPPSVRDYSLFLTTEDWEMTGATLSKQATAPTKTATLTFVDHTLRYDGKKYFGTPLTIEPGENHRDLNYCTGSAIFRFRDPDGRLLSSPFVLGNGTHLTNGEIDLTVSTISTQSYVSYVDTAEVELFGLPADYKLTTLRVSTATAVGQPLTTVNYPSRNISLGCNTTKIYDVPGPVLDITSPRGEAITNVQTLPVTGRTFSTAAISSVTVNGASATLTPVVGGNPNEVSFTRDLTLADGENLITTIAVDSNGAQAIDELMVYIDPWVPTVSIAVPAEGDSFFSSETNIPVHVVAADRGYGYSLQVYLDGALIHSASGAADGANPVELVYADTLPVLPLGEHVLTATVTDRAGSSVSASSNFTIELYEAPPILHGLIDQTLEATSAAGAVAHFEVTATSQCNTGEALTGPPAPVLTPQSNSSAVANISKIFRWDEVASPDGHPVEYQVQLSGSLDFANIDYSSAWQAGTSWVQSLPIGTWYWRVLARDSVETLLQSSPATGNSFTIFPEGSLTKAIDISNSSIVLASGALYPNVIDGIYVGPFEGDDGGDVDRSLLMFDTSVLGSEANITAAKLNLDYREKPNPLLPVVVEVHESTWELPGNYNAVGALLTSLPIPVSQPLGKVGFTIPIDYIKANGITKFALKTADEGFSQNPLSDIGFAKTTSKLEITYTLGTSPWAAPMLTPVTNLASATEVADITFNWSETPAADGDPVQYLLEISSVADFSTLSYNSPWQDLTTWTQTLPAGTWYWRVTARDAVHPAVLSNTAASSFILTYEPTVPAGDTFVSCSPASGATFPLGDNLVTCTALDSCNRSAQGSFTIAVRDSVPPILVLPEYLIAESTSAAGAAILFNVSATDAIDPAPVVSCLPASGSIFAIGDHTVSCSALDAGGNSVAGSFQLTVVQGNRAPLAQEQSVVGSEDADLPILLAATDADGDALTYTVLAQPQYGTLTGTPPVLSYRPQADYAGADSFSFSAHDGSLSSLSAMVLIEITPVNDAPIAHPQTAAAIEDTPLVVTLAASDSENDALTYVVTTQPAYGTLSGTAPELTYIPAADYSGPDSFSFTVSDGSLTSASAMVSIAVAAVNDIPAAHDQSVSTVEDTPLALVLTGDDVETPVLTYTVTTAPAYGTLSGSGAELTYTPAADYSGPDSFVFQVSDGFAFSNYATVTLVVRPENDVPSAFPQILEVDNNASLQITLAGSDVETATENLQYQLVTPPLHGALSGTPPLLDYVPDANYSGPDSLTFVVIDRGDPDNCGEAGEACTTPKPSAPATISIDVIDSTPPITTLVTYPATLSNDPNPVFGFLGSDNVSTSDELVFECSLDFAEFLPCGDMGTFTTQYTGLTDGQHTFQVRSKDQAGNLDLATASLTWTIDATVPDTKIDSQPSLVSSSSTASFTFYADELNSTLLCALDGGEPVPCNGGSMSYDGLADGEHTFTVAATDQAGNVDLSAASYTWTIDTTAPQTSIDSHPLDPTDSTVATFTFQGNDPAGRDTFQCRLDGGSFAPCESPITYTDLAPGTHTFEVLTTDWAGNTGAAPESFSWTIGLVKLDQYTMDSDFKRFNGFDVVFGKGNGGNLKLKDVNPAMFHYQIKLTNETGVAISPENGNASMAIITVPGMPASCGGVPCSPEIGASANPAFELKGRKVVDLWTERNRRDGDDDRHRNREREDRDDRDEGSDTPVTVEYLTLTQYQANGNSCADNAGYSTNMPADAAPKCIKISNFTIPVKHEARIRLAFKPRFLGTDGWDQDSRQAFYAGFPFQAKTSVALDGRMQVATDTTGLVGAGSKVTAIGGYAFDALGSPLNGAAVRLFTKESLASCSDDSNLIAQDVVDENGFYYIWRTGMSQDTGKAPSLPAGLNYAVQVCEGASPVALRLTENKLRDKEFEQVDFD